MIIMNTCVEIFCIDAGVSVILATGIKNVVGLLNRAILFLSLVSVVIDGVVEPSIKAVEAEGHCHIGFGRRHLIKHSVAYNAG